VSCSHWAILLLGGVKHYVPKFNPVSAPIQLGEFLRVRSPFDFFGDFLRRLRTGAMFIQKVSVIWRSKQYESPTSHP